EADNHPGKGGYYPSENVVIANNTLVDNDVNIIIGQLYKLKSETIVPVKNVTFKENAIVGNVNPTPMIKIIDAPQGAKYEGNQFFKGNVKDLENTSGITIKDPGLSLGADGMYHYSKNSPLKKNIIAPPLKRTEVGPEWIKTRWTEFGIKDTPYID